jgi:hypothetical protein
MNQTQHNRKLFAGQSHKPRISEDQCRESINPDWLWFQERPNVFRRIRRPLPEERAALVIVERGGYGIVVRTSVGCA